MQKGNQTNPGGASTAARTRVPANPGEGRGALDGSPPNHHATTRASQRETSEEKQSENSSNTYHRPSIVLEARRRSIATARQLQTAMIEAIRTPPTTSVERMPATSVAITTAKQQQTASNSADRPAERQSEIQPKYTVRRLSSGFDVARPPERTSSKSPSDIDRGERRQTAHPSESTHVYRWDSTATEILGRTSMTKPSPATATNNSKRELKPRPVSASLEVFELRSYSEPKVSNGSITRSVSSNVLSRPSVREQQPTSVPLAVEDRPSAQSARFESLAASKPLEVKEWPASQRVELQTPMPVAATPTPEPPLPTPTSEPLLKTPSEPIKHEKPAAEEKSVDTAPRITKIKTVLTRSEIERLLQGYFLVNPEYWPLIGPGSHISYFKHGGADKETRFVRGGLIRHSTAEQYTIEMPKHMQGIPRQYKVQIASMEEIWKRYSPSSAVEIAMLYRVIKEDKARIAALEARLDSLETHLARLQKM